MSDNKFNLNDGYSFSEDNLLGVDDFSFSSDFEDSFNSLINSSLDEYSDNDLDSSLKGGECDIYSKTTKDDYNVNDINTFDYSANFDINMLNEQYNEDVLNEQCDEDTGLKQSYKRNGRTIIFRLGLILCMISVFIGVTAHKSGPSKKISDFNNIIDVVSVSNKTILDNYAKLNNLALKKDSISQSEYYISINDIKKSFEDTYTSVENLNNLSNKEDYAEILNIVESKLNNGISLCDTMIKSDGDINVSVYNDHVSVENKLTEELVSHISEKADKLNINYKIENESFIIDTN